MISALVTAVLAPEPEDGLPGFRPDTPPAEPPRQASLPDPGPAVEADPGPAVEAAASAAHPSPTGPTVAALADATTAQSILRTALGRVPGLTVRWMSTSLDVPMLQALWRAHRNKFTADGDLALAGAASKLLRSLDLRRAQPAAIVADTPEGTALLWVDLSTRELVAAFRDPERFLDLRMLEPRAA